MVVVTYCSVIRAALLIKLVCELEIIIFVWILLLL